MYSCVPLVPIAGVLSGVPHQEGLRRARPQYLSPQPCLRSHVLGPMVNSPWVGGADNSITRYCMLTRNWVCLPLESGPLLGPLLCILLIVHVVNRVGNNLCIITKLHILST